MLIGIDPGSTTGIALWDRADRMLRAVTSTSFVLASEYLRETIAVHGAEGVEVWFEDARARKWFGDADARQKRSGAGIREGVGSVKRDCSLWEELCGFHKIAFRAIRPQKGATKLKAPEFGRLTGWQGKTNEHARDAAMLVFGG